MSKFSSPASAGDLQSLYQNPSNNNSLSTPLSSVTENIEVEKKVELVNLDALHEFEDKVKRAGGFLKKEKQFSDCYYDSLDLLLTRTDHYLRDRDGVWELKVPCAENSTHTSVYQELEGPNDIAKYFFEKFPHGNVQLPFETTLPNESGITFAQQQDATVVISPFVAFTTRRRQWELFMRDETFSIDVDEASFGCFLAEFEVMCHTHVEVEDALSRIDLVCADLGVVGALNQDRASKFVKFILLDPELLARTQTHAPAVLLTGDENII